MSNWELAYKDYKDGMKYKDIADKYGVSINTVKSWRTRKWKELETGADAKSAHTTQKGAHTKQPKLVIDNDDLTEQQKMFCIYYLQSFNATKAYQKAYQSSYDVAHKNSYLLMAKDGVKKELTRLKAELQQEVHIDTKDLINELARQVKADIKDYVEFGQEVATNEAGDNYIKSFMRFKDMDEVDGTLIDSIKLGKDGVSVQLPSKQKAIDMLLKYIDTDTEADTHAKVINRGNDEMQEWLDGNT